jgi:hypothetical protein
MLMSAPRTARTRRTAVTSFAAIALCALSSVSGLDLTPASARATHTPTGSVSVMRRSGYGMAVRGVAADADTAGPATVLVRVDNVRVAQMKAADPNPPGTHAPPTHGFNFQVPLTTGPHQVCVWVRDYPNWHQIVQLKCANVNYDYNPQGDFTLTQSPGKLTATGWGIDFDAPKQQISYVIRLDAKAVASGTADQNDPTLGTQHPAAGPLHGFTTTFPVTEGSHRVCLKLMNYGAEGVNTIVKCYYPYNVNFSPTGQVRVLMQHPGGIHIGGYASDPDTTAPTSVRIVDSSGRTVGTAPANGVNTIRPGHGFSADFLLPGKNLTPGPRTFCVIARNRGTYGSDKSIGCLTHTFNWNPSGAITGAAQSNAKAVVTGWATDPDTAKPIKVQLLVDGKQLSTVTANSSGGSHPGHMFTANVAVPAGKHTVCAVAVNTLYGSGNSAPSCATVTMRLDPYGAYESLSRNGSNIVATGWAIDPETTSPINVQVLVDGTATTVRAKIARPDVAAAHPGTGTSHGFSSNIAEPSTDGEHKVCVQAVNTGGGSTPYVPLGCKVLNAVHPTAPAAPTRVTAVGGYGGAQVTWQPSPSDGGAPWTGYTVRALPSGPAVQLPVGVTSTTVTGLQSSTSYTFSVVATNVAGSSTPAVSPSITTQKAPPPQTSPAPISTSRYIRNITGAGSGDLSTLRREGAADAAANPSGHGYMIVLAIGGQDESRHGVILSAGIRFISYSDIVKNLQSYVDGYSSKQRPSAPLTIAIATNNDIDVSYSSGASFANNVIDPVQSYARRYPGITIAGSDDMEPGFLAGYSSTKAWLQGYLKSTSAPFVFTGSADGCAWNYTNGSCNNGWTMAGLYYLTGGAYPIRMINLPQVYNTTMAAQWRYISLTGVRQGNPKINFGGALTEWTACQQAGSCGSLTGNNAWRAMWAQLRADPALKPTSLPYSTDLRIDS